MKSRSQGAVKKGRTIRPRRSTAQTRLAAILHAAQAVASSLDFEEVLQAIVREASAIAGTPVVRLFLLEEETRVLRCRVGLGPLQEAERDLVVPVGESFSGEVAATGLPLAVADCRQDPRLLYPEHATQHGLISYLGLPVKLGGRILGVLVFNTARPRLYTKDEIAYLSTFAEQAAIAIQNAQLFQREQARRRQVEAVRETGEEITRELDLSRVLALIIRRSIELVGADSGIVRLWDEAQGLLIPYSHEGMAPHRLFRLRPGEGIAGVVAQRRAGMIVNDFQTSSAVSPHIQQGSAVYATIAQPLLYRDRLVGVISIFRETPGRPFNEEDQALLGLFAAQAVIAIENARLFQQEQARRQQFEAVRAVSEEIIRELDLPAALRLINQRAAELVGATSGTVFLWEEGAEVLFPAAWHGFGDWIATIRIQLGEGIAGRVAEQREGLLVNDYRGSPLVNPIFREQTRITAALVEPLLYHQRLVGVIAINHDQPGRRFTLGDRDLLRLFAAQAAIAIENARMHGMTARRANQLATLNEVTRALTTTLDPQAVAQEILEAVRRLIPEAAGRLWKQAGDEAAYHLVAEVGLGRVAGGRTRVVRRREGVFGISIATREPVVVKDIAGDPRYIHQDWAAGEGLKSCIMLPLIHGERVKGILTIYTRAMREFGDDEVSLLRSFAAQAAIALENARLYAASEGRAQELGALREIGQAITARLELPAVLGAVVAGAMQLLGTQHAQIILWDEASQRLRYGAAVGPEAERVRTQSFELGRGINGMVAQTRQPMILDDYRASSYALPEFSHVFATITVPIIFGDRLLGVLHSHTTQPNKRFTTDDLRLLQMLATQVAVAIENAGLYREVQEHAAVLEQRVEERTRALKEAQAELVQSAKLAAVGTLAAGVAHELNQPLTVIRGYAQGLLAEEGLPAEARADLDRIEAQTVRMARIINHLRDFSRQSKGVLEPVALHEVIEAAFLLVTQQLRSRNIEVVRELDSELPLLQGDRIQLEQVFVNLITNARDAMTPQGGGRLTVATRITDRSVEAAVADTGPGVPASIRDRIFEPFFTTKEVGQGTGLGLSISYGIVHEHGGEIQVADGPDGGAVFIVRLPVGSPAAAGSGP